MTVINLYVINHEIEQIVLELPDQDQLFRGHRFDDVKDDHLGNEYCNMRGAESSKVRNLYIDMRTLESLVQASWA
ncbi:uncharacterized protein PpBr36_09665 [Pyricularia pennisetigena]|uniref:uncharacterized protein n=1 Tax=Pyricularia pennisetigena TaxID=1578925 RepID=UPI001154E4F5|nr:uncharacterized protein PpBr36_09665 [Pyricularia pennisetigena]TLS22131.1 hypothetical protein PpBr36_09665 [Pyricularia pennisetigena]